MKISEIYKLVEDLSWEKPQEIQLNALEKLQSIDDEYTPYLIPEEGKYCWENAVKVLYKIGYPRNRLAIPRLIWLLQDFNWPGVSSAIELLQKIDKNIILPYIEDALIKAHAQEDYMWIGGIKRLIGILGILKNDFKSSNIIQILDLADW